MSPHAVVPLLSDINQTVRIVLYSVIFLLSVLGNSLIIAVLVRNRRMRTVTNLFLLSLAVSDLMVSLVCIPFTLIPNLMRNFIFGTGICKLVMYFMGELSDNSPDLPEACLPVMVVVSNKQQNENKEHNSSVN